MKEKKDLIRYAILCIVVLFLVIHYWDLAMTWIGTFLRATQPLLAGCIIAYILNEFLRAQPAEEPEDALHAETQRFDLSLYCNPGADPVPDRQYGSAGAALLY